MGAPFTYQPSPHVPFRDMEALERCRRIKREDIAKHPNPKFRIQVVPDDMVEFIWVADMFSRIQASAEAGERLVIITPNPCPSYAKVAYFLNKRGVDCSRVHTFNMDEYADQDGNVAPESWEHGFTYAFKKYFYSQLDPKLRPPERQLVGFTNKNLKDYGKMIADLGGADICYSGPGWTGHLAFIEPDAPEFAAPLAEWREMGPRIVTLSPFTLAQNSLHGSFGMSGDLAMVPPKAATIGPAEVVGAKARLDVHSLSVHGTATSWQRLTTRLVLHGPVTPLVPESILQTLETDVLVSETAAMNIETNWNKGY